MNDYKPASRTAAFGAAALALAMTAITIGFAVVAPAKVDSGARFRALEALQPSSEQPAPLAAAPMRIEVVAVRDSAWAPVQARAGAPRQKLHGAGRSGGRSVAAPERVGYGRASAPVPCYLTKGTVDATS